MRLFLALSCFQTRPMQRAWDDLVKLEPDGIQLTPGCVPSFQFQKTVEHAQLLVMFHQGFTYDAYRSRAWPPPYPTFFGRESGHPPYRKDQDFDTWLKFAVTRPDITYETMWGPYLLSKDREFQAAMDAKLRLAVDVSHLYIQLNNGQLSKPVLAKLQNYEYVDEIHVSANSGKSDSHLPLKLDTFGLDWAKERGSDGTPVVLESYFHKLSIDEQNQQLEFLRC